MKLTCCLVAFMLLLAGSVDMVRSHSPLCPGSGDCIALPDIQWAAL
jgi:hypothetical protein